MDLNALIKSVKENPEFKKAGMLLCHNGVVRQSSRDGKMVSGLEVEVDHERLKEVIKNYSSRSGIIDIKIEIAENKFLKVGDDVMYIVVAGDVRENVIGTLSDTLNDVKATVTTKKEHYI